jgi:hypothetical protein
MSVEVFGNPPWYLAGSSVPYVPYPPHVGPVCIRCGAPAFGRYWGMMGSGPYCYRCWRDSGVATEAAKKSKSTICLEIPRTIPYRKSDMRERRL